MDHERTVNLDTGLTDVSKPKARRRTTRQKRSEITLHQLHIFWAVAHSDTLTKAAKQLGLTQPSLVAAIVQAGIDGRHPALSPSLQRDDAGPKPGRTSCPRPNTCCAACANSTTASPSSASASG